MIYLEGQAAQAARPQSSPELRLMYGNTADDKDPEVPYIHMSICVYIYIYCMYYATRFPMVLVYEVYLRSCRISAISSRC